MFHYQTCFLLQICSLFNFYLAIEVSLREVSYVLSRIRALAHLRALMTRKSCAIGMRNAKLRNYLPAGITELRIHLLPGWGWGWRFCFTVYIARKLLMVLHVGWEDSPPSFWIFWIRPCCLIHRISVSCIKMLYCSNSAPIFFCIPPSHRYGHYTYFKLFSLVMLLAEI